MNAVDELKARARIRLNAARRDGGGADLRLRDVLRDVAREVGFNHWDHARRVLGGLALPGEDMGTFWFAPRTGTLNEWHATPARAQAAMAGREGLYLLPYKRQAVLVQAPFVDALGLDPAHPAWASIGRDLAAAYGQAAWSELAALRVRAPRSSFA